MPRFGIRLYVTVYQGLHIVMWFGFRMYAQVYTGLHIVMRFGFSVYANVYACWIQYICQSLRVRACVSYCGLDSV